MLTHSRNPHPHSQFGYRLLAHSDLSGQCLCICASKLAHLHSRCPDFYRKEKTGFLKIRSEVAGAVRVELTSTVLETAVLPLNYAPIFGSFDHRNSLYLNYRCSVNKFSYFTKFLIHQTILGVLFDLFAKALYLLGWLVSFVIK